MSDRLKIDPTYSREILIEVMEELLLIGAIEAMESVLKWKFDSGGEGCEVVITDDIQDLIDDHKLKILHLRKRLYPPRRIENGPWSVEEADRRIGDA